jgi:hypothetical protein
MCFRTVPTLSALLHVCMCLRHVSGAGRATTATYDKVEGLSVGCGEPVRDRNMQLIVVVVV